MKVSTKADLDYNARDTTSHYMQGKSAKIKPMVKAGNMESS